MNAKGKRARARRDASEAVHTLADAGRIVAGSAASSVSGSVSGTVSDLAGTLSERVDDARHALAGAIDPAPVKVHRTPWLLAVVLLSALAAYAWATVLRRERPADPGTPVSTEPPSTDQLSGKPVGSAPTQAEL